MKQEEKDPCYARAESLAILSITILLKKNRNIPHVLGNKLRGFPGRVLEMPLGCYMLQIGKCEIRESN